jgi:hypothetical protein
MTKQYGIFKKMRCYWERLKEHIGNLGNTLGTNNPSPPPIKKIPPPPPSQNPKEKNTKSPMK